MTAERYILKLYVTGMTSRSARAIENLQALLRETSGGALRPAGHRRLPAARAGADGADRCGSDADQETAAAIAAADRRHVRRGAGPRRTRHSSTPVKMEREHGSGGRLERSAADRGAHRDDWRKRKRRCARCARAKSMRSSYRGRGRAGLHAAQRRAALPQSRRGDAGRRGHPDHRRRHRLLQPPVRDARCGAAGGSDRQALDRFISGSDRVAFAVLRKAAPASAGHG